MKHISIILETRYILRRLILDYICASQTLTYMFLFIRLLSLTQSLPDHLHLYPLHSLHCLSPSTCHSLRVFTSQQESRDAECWAHKFCTVWNRRWLPRTAGRFFNTGAFLVPPAPHGTKPMLGYVFMYVYLGLGDPNAWQQSRQKWVSAE